MSTDGVLSEQEFLSAVETLRKLAPCDELAALQPSGPATVYTTLVTIWMMILQRLGGGQSLDAVVKEVLSHSAGLLPDNKRVREKRLSESTGAYSDARMRLRLETVEWLAERVSHSLIAVSPPAFNQRQVFLFDGTTITLAPTPELTAAFPPATNQFGNSVWPVAMLLVAHELQSSCALPPEIGAMYGENNTSEGELARRLAKRLPRGSYVILDAGFGIFSVVSAISGEGHAVLSRVTKSRFKALIRQATLIDKSEGQMTWQLHWTPSNKDRLTNPELPADASVNVYLHQIPLEKDVLLLVSTLPITNEEAAEHYSHRYDVEHDIRDIKVSLQTENIRARSVDMMKKELLTSFIAYNLVVQFRRQAATIAGVPPRRLSFTGVWNTFQSFLLKQTPCTALDWIGRYEVALNVASRAKLPNRPGRSYPRKAHPRRQKSTKFMKSERNEKTSDSS